MKDLPFDSDFVIRLTNVSKKYTIHHEKPTLAERLIHGKHETFMALKNISVTIRRGEKVGIIGANGSGKTTLLKIITGITSPSTGSVETRGKLVSLIDLEAGFHPELTGLENVYLNGMLLGMKRAEIDKRLPQIIRFADIKQFIDVPLYTYSAGMKLRLGFSIAIQVDPDILLLDEGMGAGDADFQRKSYLKIQEYFKQQKTILLVSQWRNLIEKYCTKVIYLHKGRIRDQGGLQLAKKYLL